MDSLTPEPVASVSTEMAASPATLFFDPKKLSSGRWNIGCLALKRSGVFV
jgi:hypothetical protein